MKITNTLSRYGYVASLLHWFMAMLIISLTILGLYMVTLPDVGFNLRKIMLIYLHKELGMVVLPLVIFRLAWRVSNILPLFSKNLPNWQKIAARVVHLLFYVFMFAMPISGWLMSSAAGFSVTIFGIPLPDLISQNNYLFQQFIIIHRWLGYGLIILICIHMTAALRHHFVYRDETLRKIL